MLARTRLRTSNTRRESGLTIEIEVALPVPDLDVTQAVPFLRQRQEALDQELELRDVDRQLVGPRPEQVAFDPDEVAEVEQLEDREVALADRVLPDVGLDLRLAVGDGDEVGLAERPHRQDAAGGPGFDPFGRELVAGLATEGRHQRAHGMRPREGVRVRVDAQALEGLEVGAPLRDLIGFCCSVDLLTYRVILRSAPRSHAR